MKNNSGFVNNEKVSPKSEGIKVKGYEALVNRIGEERVANNGLMMKIVGYRNANDIDVLFEDGTLVVGKSYASFLKGSIAKKKTELECISDSLTELYDTFCDDGAKIREIIITFVEDHEFQIISDKGIFYINNNNHLVDKIIHDASFALKRYPHKSAVINKLYRRVMRYINYRKINVSKVTFEIDNERFTTSGVTITSESVNYVEGFIHFSFSTNLSKA